MSGPVIFKLPLVKVRGRLDPRANQPLVQELRNRLKYGLYPANPLGAIANFRKVIVNQLVDGVTYIGLENINGTDGEYAPTSDRESVSSAAIFSSGDILFPKLRPYLNKTHLANFDGICSTEFHVLKVFDVSPEYVTAILRTNSMVQLTSQWMTGNTLPRLQTADIQEIPIPIPPKSIQKQVVDLMSLAYGQKKRLEIEATALLAQVDGVLLKHLGINLPKRNSGAIGGRIFIRKLSAMEHRLDSLFYQTSLLDFLQSSYFPIQVLSSVVNTFQSGFAAGKGDQVFDKGVIQIRPTNINEDREFIFDRNVYLPEKLLQEFPNDRLQKGEVLFNNTNSQELVGKTVFFDLDGDYFCSNHITRIGVDTTKLNPRYLCAVLNAYQRMKIFYAMCVNWNNQSGINIEALRKLRIPVPSLTIQANIVAEFELLESQARTLRQQALQKLDTAKAQVEHLIFGIA
ncbi:restriction endonuclease subunit S [Rhodoferax sp.]|uniref:restriction endonuclease subunit S n=1 Tax=Rhodoferax sp. TaxID=50421 RepID=UPI0026236C9E|nr:restriction endonuclease subunit S [Rhodoferax sp.]MDD5480155.1 restriction endonuclease subunit S [Rhodoferax sp.]